MKIGLLGGTFDPIHGGHLHIARAAAAALSLDRVLLVVAGVPPHKRGAPVTEAVHRFAMAVLATADDPLLFASSRELQRPGPSYTIDTLRDFESQAEGDRFCFVAGGDSLAEIHSWKDYGKLLREHCFVFVQRPDFGHDPASLGIPDSLKKNIRTVCENDKPSIQPGSTFLVQADAPLVRSTQIREIMEAGGEPPAGSIPPEIVAHIRKYRLYEQNPRNPRQSLRRHQR